MNGQLELMQVLTNNLFESIRYNDNVANICDAESVGTNHYASFDY